ncbi:MAG: N-acetylmuramoyl-L-alanine amidase [Clostridia bacterium]|nr:N-acetylmuramoyl-L-alanine amidase [Clostridia bacterium]
MAKIYLSPALHGNDNPTKCPVKCSENTHCGQYVDRLEKRLKELGFSVKRGGPATGTEAMYARVRESNAWGADLHYVAHTNAGGGRYSMTMCWNDAINKKAANVMNQYRKALPPGSWHKVVPNNDLYEIRATRAVCLYDELIFHDNAEDCRWFHDGGMEKMAEDAVKAFCDWFDVPYRSENAGKPAINKPAAFALSREPLYVSSTAKSAVGTATGNYYRWDNKVINGRVRITVKPEWIGKAGQVTGWISEKAVK